jgi:predicted RNase H-like nuclease (RuvC/YqgF family)
MDAITSVEALLLGAKMDAIKDSVTELRGTMGEMTKALNTLIRVEQKQIEHTEDIKRLDNRIDKLDADHEGRLQFLERKMPGLIEMRLWAMSGVMSVVAAVGYAVISGHLR